MVFYLFYSFFASQKGGCDTIAINQLQFKCRQFFAGEEGKKLFFSCLRSCNGISTEVAVCWYLLPQQGSLSFINRHLTGPVLEDTFIENLL